MGWEVWWPFLQCTSNGKCFFQAACSLWPSRSHEDLLRARQEAFSFPVFPQTSADRVLWPPASSPVSSPCPSGTSLRGLPPHNAPAGLT